MICRKCGTQLSDEAKFCLKCGVNTRETVILSDRKTNVIPAEPAPEQKPRKTISNKLKVIAAAAFLIIVIIAGVIVAITIISSPVNTFEKNINNGDYESALKIYDGKIIGNEKDEARIQEYLTAHIAKIVTQFDNKSLTYAEADKSLKIISETGVFEGTELTDAYSHIEKLDASRTAFAAAEKLLASKDYVGAIGQYQAVIASDDNYAAAQSQLDAASQEYRTAILNQADQFAAENSFDKAITVMNAALKILPKDSELLQQLTLYESRKVVYEKATALSSAENYMGQNEYEKALNVISAALIGAPGDADLQNALTEYQTKFIANVKKEAGTAFGTTCKYEAALKIIKAGLDILPGNTELIVIDAGFQTQYVKWVISAADTAFAADHNYETAVAAINAALSILPNNTTLNAKKDEYLSYQPVWLTNLDYFNSSNSIKIDGFNVMKDNTGTGYAHSICGYSNGFIEYLMNGNYSKFTFTCAVPYSERTTTSNQYVEVYGDGVLLCSTGIMTGGVDPQPVSIDITGVQKLKIVFSGDYYSYIAAVWDPQLHK